MKRLNLYCFIGGFLLILVGVVKIVHFAEAQGTHVECTAYRIGQYVGMAFFPLFGLLMLIESIRRFKLEN